MKRRLRQNSIRLKVRKSEVERLLESGECRETIVPAQPEFGTLRESIAVRKRHAVTSVATVLSAGEQTYLYARRPRV